MVNQCISRAILYGHFVICYAANTSPFEVWKVFVKEGVFT